MHCGLIASGGSVLGGGLRAAMRKIAAKKGQCGGADINGDGIVDQHDLQIIMQQFGKCGDCDDCPADIDGNCIVDMFDVLIVVENWGCKKEPGDENVCTFPGVCGTFQVCGTGSPFDCFCWTIDGNPDVGLCFQDFLCTDVAPCPPEGCPPGFACVTGSCCGTAVCAPIIKCDDTAVSNPPEDGQAAGLTGTTMNPAGPVLSLQKAKHGNLGSADLALTGSGKMIQP